MPYVSVHIDLDEFDDDELVEELEIRGYRVSRPTNRQRLAALSMSSTLRFVD